MKKPISTSRRIAAEIVEQILRYEGLGANKVHDKALIDIIAPYLVDTERLDEAELQRHVYEPYALGDSPHGYVSYEYTAEPHTSEATLRDLLDELRGAT